MPIANLEELCKSFCETAGIEVPDIVPDVHGSLSFATRVKDVPVTVLQVQDRTDMAYILVELGAMPQEIAIDGKVALLQLNAMVPGRQLPVFSRNPDNGELVLQQTIALWDASPSFVFERVWALAETALEWRAHRFLHDEEPATDMGDESPGEESVPEDDDPDAAKHVARLEHFHREIRAAQGMPVEPLTCDTAGTRMFDIPMDEIGAALIHAPLLCAHEALVVVNLGSPDALGVEVALDALLEANFSWLTQEHAPVCGCHPFTGDFLVQFAYPLESADAEDLLERVAGLEDWSRLWRHADPFDTRPRAE